MRIIVRVRELRKNHNLTQEELAKQLNISRQSLISLEQGRWLPSLPLALQLAAFFNEPLEEVIQSHVEAANAVLQHADLPLLDAMPEMKAAPMNRPLHEAQQPYPVINIREDEQSYSLEAHVPGYGEDEIDIDITESTITIAGNTTHTDSTGYVQQEYHHQSFSRTLSLPTLILNDSATAKLKNGILNITLPKQTENKPKTKRLKLTTD